MRMRGVTTRSWDKSIGLDTTLGVTINGTFKFSSLGIEIDTEGLLGISEHRHSNTINSSAFQEMF